MKGDNQPDALQPELQAIQKTKNKGADGTLDRVPVAENDHGNGHPSAPADHIDQKHILMGQSKKGAADTH